jgi:hypothetical protein
MTSQNRPSERFFLRILIYPFTKDFDRPEALPEALLGIARAIEEGQLPDAVYDHNGETCGTVEFVRVSP